MKILKNEITLEKFYVKRFKKILPFFALLVFADLIMSPSIESLYEAFADFTLMFGFLPNAGNISVIGVGWFLGLVFVFYICFPFYCVLIQNKKRAWIAFGISVIYNLIGSNYFEINRTNILYSACFFIAGGLVYLYRNEISKIKEAAGEHILKVIIETCYLSDEEKIKIQEIIVVEGKDDTANLRRFYEVDTYETRGSAINEDDLERIDKLNDLRGVIVFTDPDYNGERIRKIIMEAVPTAKHAFLNRGEATPKSKTKGRSLGVEHASFEDLQKALSGVLGSYDDDNQFDISKSNLMKLGLLMGADSRKRREYLGEALRIGYCNGKQLLKRLELFGITLEELEEAMSNY